MEFLTFTLPNGIRCIYKKVRSSVCHCALTVNAGSRDELAGEHGVAHLTEHAIFKGTERRRAFHISSRLENLGGELNAFTTKEDTTIHATTLRADFPKAAELISDVVFHSTFPVGEIEREKQVIIDEINSYRDIPQEMIYDDFEGLLFAGSPLGRNILGTRQSVGRQSGEAIRRFMERTYTPDQMVFSAIGGVSESTFTKIAEQFFGAIPSVTRDFNRAEPPVYDPFERTTSKNGNHQAHCIVGNRAYNLRDERRVALSLLINVLGGPSSNSRLNMVLRERNGLSYNIEAGYSPFIDTGFAGVYFACEKENTERCRELVNQEIDRLAQTPLSPRQLSMAKKQFIGQYLVSMESNEGYMLGAAKSLLLYGEVDSLKTICDRIEAITTDEVMTAARDTFTHTSTIIYR
jgi:predicted Zn-dependent peptidase